MPLVYSFKVGSYAAIAGASFSSPRLDVILLMDDYVNKHLSRELTSKEIESYLAKNFRKNENDFRSLISLMKKCSFINFRNSQVVKGDNFYTTEGKLFVQLIRILGMDMPDSARYHIQRAYHLLLQKAIIRMLHDKVAGADNLLLMLKVISITRYLTLDEYLYAISEKCINPVYSIEKIARFIIKNRDEKNNYRYMSLSSNKPIADSAMQFSRELLQQAGVFKSGQTVSELKTDEFLVKNNISAYE